ncbi:MAG: hypothetical protein CM15mP109_08040 [Candidatus Dadabacteria bacterium]|nr:MAG: hypothetical protein CM15mP109_08040 [Candidatus Dadabacteria bacterium]
MKGHRQSLVQGRVNFFSSNARINFNNITEEKLMESYPALWMPMIETADIVAKRYNISREAQDEYSLQSQQRTAAAQDAGLYKMK